MANPKRRTSKSRRDKRRTHDSITMPATTTCTNCGATRRPHRVCDSCGWYAGKEAVAVDSE